MGAHPQPKLTPEQYLELERKAETPSEYYKGEMFAMAGASYRHAQIKSNVVYELRKVTQKPGCDVLPTEVKLLVSKTGLYAYPDVMVICGEPKFVDDERDILTNPVVVIEVLSPSTADYDRGGKFAHYRTVESVREYIVVAQERPYIEHHTRESDGSWRLVEISGLDQVLHLKSINADPRLRKFISGSSLTRKRTIQI
jgi:Uma2 family endonuclease